MNTPSANTPLETPLERLLSRLERVRCHGDSYMARCPAHDDHTPSLSIRTSKTGDVLLHCFAGCSPESVVAACGLSLRDLFARPESSMQNCRFTNGSSQTDERRSRPPEASWQSQRSRRQDRPPIARPTAARRSSSGHDKALPDGSQNEPSNQYESDRTQRSTPGSPPVPPVRYSASLPVLQPRPQQPLRREVAEASVWKHIATYPYTDETGTVLFSVDRLERSVRYPDAPEHWHPQKRFLQWHLDAAGQRVNNVKGCRMVLYMLPEVRRAVADGSPVVIVEGEKDADTANLFFREEIGNGYVATTNAGGAGKWRPEYSVSLAGAHVILCGDADLAGIEHMVHVGRSIASLVRSIRFVDIGKLLREGTQTDALLRENNSDGRPIQAWRDHGGRDDGH